MFHAISVRARWVASFLALALLLAGASYVATRYLTLPASAEEIMSVQKWDGGEEVITSKSVTVDMERAPELPTTKADVAGILVRREDSSLFVGTGNLTGKNVIGEDGSVGVALQTDGPVLEVVVTHNTRVYRDVTDLNTGGTVQQELRPGSADEIEENGVVIAWGNKRGEWIVADTLVYRRP